MKKIVSLQKQLILMETSLLFIIILALIIIIVWQLYVNNKAKSKNSALINDIAVAQTNLEILSKQSEKSAQKNLLLEEEIKRLNALNSSFATENARMSERLNSIQIESVRLKSEAENQFKNLANEIMNANTKAFKESSETRLGEILAPLKENIENFKKSIEEKYNNEAKERFSLQGYIERLIELNKNIGKEAQDLTKALKGNSKVQGDWGERILENILEKSGLTKGLEFIVQETRDDNGNILKSESGGSLRPDVIVMMPDSKKMVIDSKVSLSSYIDYVNCDDVEAQKEYLRLHITSMKNHIKELKKKSYQDVVDKASEFVLMFIPNEGAYIAAMQNDPNLWQEAYDSRVVIVSPTHLISILRIVTQLWNHDKQTKNAIEIAEAGGRLYDKFYGFIEDMNSIGKSLTSTRDSYDKAMNKLSEGNGNLISRVESLKKLGAKATKSLPLN